MSKSVRFVFCVHIHQPVLNFGHVFQQIYRECYAPFLDVMERHPSIVFNLHASGALLDWFQEHQPDYLLRLRRMTDAGRLELVGGGYYEPILTMLPTEDAVGQLEMMREYLRKTFTVEVAGAWLAERVWEPHLPSWLAAAGVRYSVLDDTHFLAAGLSEEKLDAPYLTEDRGRLLTLFPLREPLRYAIPFKDPSWTIHFLEERAREDGRAVVVYADDGEKFGAWPGTHKHVYESGWLESFLRALEDHAGVIKTSTFSQAMEAVPPAGRIYLPSCSYREMGEWSLPAEAQSRFRSLKFELERSDLWGRTARYFTGGVWRNFRVKYPEANLMYARMLGISRRVAALPPKAPARRAAQLALYKAQCNCPYWHGVFGGLYLSHLRHAVYSHLIQAENAIENDARASVRFPAAWLEDYDLDGEKDLRVFNPMIGLFICPRRGGSIFELDVRTHDLNVLTTLARRREAYHDDLPAASAKNEGSVATIHAAPKALAEGLGQHLRVDPYLRGALIDHFYAPGAELEAIETHEGERGDLFQAPYAYKMTRAGGRLSAVLTAAGKVAGQEVGLTKEIRIERMECGYQAQYAIQNRSASPLEARFGVEFNVALFSPEAPGAFFHGGDRKPLGDLRTRKIWPVEKEFWALDTWRGLQVGWFVSRPCGMVTYPVQTVSLSERGFELTYQGTAVMPTWDLELAPGESWSAVVTQRFVDIRK